MRNQTFPDLWKSSLYWENTLSELKMSSPKSAETAHFDWWIASILIQCSEMWTIQSQWGNRVKTIPKIELTIPNNPQRDYIRHSYVRFVTIYSTQNQLELFIHKLGWIIPNSSLADIFDSQWVRIDCQIHNEPIRNEQHDYISDIQFMNDSLFWVGSF